MARKALVEKEKKRSNLHQKYAEKRKQLTAIIKNPATTLKEKREAQAALEKLPNNSSITRMRNRCALSGRPRAFMRTFNLSRLAFRKFALLGLLPGVKKASW
ncbi:30S ribosomal protein S14 [Candidatus Dependentiae bacterium]|nr:30S ribosomal protein S14 [Candidatus Dependentiae bacterium]